MLAAPIVALGIIHPDGQHEIFGHANPAIMMLTNVFVRPSLMIFGLVGSVALSYITVAYFNFGFQIVMEKLFVGGISGITSTVAMLVIYTLLILAFIQKAFSLIYEVPDKIMAWVGHTGATPGSINAQEISQMLDTAKGGATTAGQVTGRAYAGISSGAISASNKAASAIGAAGGGGGGEATGGGGGGGMPAGGGNEEHMPKG